MKNRRLLSVTAAVKNQFCDGRNDVSRDEGGGINQWDLLVEAFWSYIIPKLKKRLNRASITIGFRSLLAK